MPNVVVIHADQLRFDGLGINGAPEGLTPNIDRLAAEGYNFTRHIAANPVCMPSRASLFTGLYPPAHGVWDNGVPLNRQCHAPPPTEVTAKHAPGFEPLVEPPTLADLFKGAGYVTASFGKLHFTPNLAHPDFGYEESYALWKTGRLDDWTGPYYGFDHVEFAQGHGEFPVTEGGHYANWLKARAPDLVADVMAGKTHGPRPIEKKRDLYPSLVPSELHNSHWLATRFGEYLDALAPDQPFFIFVGFPDPHHPFTPPHDALEAVADLDLPAVRDPQGATEARLLQRKRGGRPGLAAKPETRAWILRYTMAMIRLMDDAVGRILNKLEDTGHADDTVVVFTSDHGDFLGDHGLCYKDLLGCHSLLHIPLLVRVPGTDGAREIARATSNVDVLPTLAGLTGIERPSHVHGQDLLQESDQGLAFSYAFRDRDPEQNNVTVYDDRHRLTCYPGQDYVELFDHRTDPAEIRNIADRPEQAAQRDRLIQAVLEANLRHSNPISGRVSCF